MEGGCRGHPRAHLVSAIENRVLSGHTLFVPFIVDKHCFMNTIQTSAGLTMVFNFILAALTSLTIHTPSDSWVCSPKTRACQEASQMPARLYMRQKSYKYAKKIDRSTPHNDSSTHAWMYTKTRHPYPNYSSFQPLTVDNDHFKYYWNDTKILTYLFGF